MCDPSTEQSSRSSRPARRSSANKAACRRGHTPASVQSRSRRQAVSPEQPTVSAGTSRHATPVRSTYITPAIATRLGTRHLRCPSTCWLQVTASVCMCSIEPAGARRSRERRAWAAPPWACPSTSMPLPGFHQRPVVGAEFGIRLVDFGVVEVGLVAAGLQVVGYQPARDAVEVAEGCDVRLGPRVLVPVQDRPHEHVP